MRPIIHALSAALILASALACSGHGGRAAPGQYGRTTFELIVNEDASPIDEDNALFVLYPTSMTIVDDRTIKVMTNGEEHPGVYAMRGDSIYINDPDSRGRGIPAYVGRDTIDIVLRATPDILQKDQGARIHMRFLRQKA